MHFFKLYSDSILVSTTSYFVSGQTFSADPCPYSLPSFLFAATQNNILVLSQTHTKSGGVSFECKGLWLTRVACWVCITCVLLAGLTLLQVYRVNCLFAIHQYQMCAHSFLNVTVRRLWQKKGNKQNSSTCTACLQGILQTKGSARAAMPACSHCFIL